MEDTKQETLLTPQQELFLAEYTNPKSDNFGNAVQSALKAGYTENYANNITGLMPEWLGRKKNYQLNRFFKSVERSKKYKEESNKGDYLYIIKCDKYYKIGIASNIDSRLNSLQCGNPFELEVVCAFRVKKARQLEKDLHNGLRQFNHKREWFILDTDFIEDLKVFIENYDKP